MYERAGLLTIRTVMAHGVTLTTQELQLLARKGTAIAHCPLSNFFFADVPLDVLKCLDLGVKVRMCLTVDQNLSTPFVLCRAGCIDHMELLKMLLDLIAMDHRRLGLGYAFCLLICSDEGMLFLNTGRLGNRCGRGLQPQHAERNQERRHQQQSAAHAAHRPRPPCIQSA